MKGWRDYLEREGNEASDKPFKILTNLFVNDEGAILGLESIRLNPNLVSENKLRNDLEFYIPQLCTFLLFGEMKDIEEFFVFLCKACNLSFFFAHRVHWFLSAMIEASQEKKENTENSQKSGKSIIELEDNSNKEIKLTTEDTSKTLELQQQQQQQQQQQHLHKHDLSFDSSLSSISSSLLTSSSSNS